MLSLNSAQIMSTQSDYYVLNPPTSFLAVILAECRRYELIKVTKKSVCQKPSPISLGASRKTQTGRSVGGLYFETSNIRPWQDFVSPCQAVAAQQIETQQLSQVRNEETN